MEGVTGVDPVVGPVVEHARTRRRSGECCCTSGGRRGADPVYRVPVTKLGRLVKDGKIKSVEEIYLFSLPVKEYQVCCPAGLEGTED